MKFNKPVPILFTIPNFITAGSGRVMLNILERLDRREFSPTVCVSRRGGALEKELESQGIPLLEQPFLIPARPYHTLPLRAWQAAQPFLPYGFKLWHSFHYLDDYTEPIIARFSGAAGWIYTKKNMTWGTRAWLLRSLFATRIVADNSEMQDEYFSTLGLRKKVRTIHHGLPLDDFHPDVVPWLGLRSQYGIDPQQPVVGCIAQVVPQKDHPNLLKAAAALPGIHFLLAGSTADKDYYGELCAMVKALGLEGRVHFCGGVANIPAFLSEVDVIVLASRYEGFPVALLEAMACAKACVASDIPGPRDQIIDGDSGLLVPSGDPAALAEALDKLIHDPELRQRLGQAARKRVEEHFSIQREVAGHEALYRELVRSGPRS